MQNIAIQIGADEGDNTFDFHKYSQYYCERDVQVLHDGLIACDKIMSENFGASIFNYLTISSYADDYMYWNGVYTGVYELGGVCRDFIQWCVVGGCVRTKNNKKIQFEECIMQDFDAVSLYPSAMYRSSLPVGIPHLINASSIPIINKKNLSNLEHPFYFVKVKVITVGKLLQFPLQSQLKDGIRQFTNDLENQEIYVDKIALEDFVNF
jgi:hypothetical protein